LDFYQVGHKSRIWQQSISAGGSSAWKTSGAHVRGSGAMVNWVV
jgi:hypothetical protein